jgi:hypothetical protein
MPIYDESEEIKKEADTATSSWCSSGRTEGNEEIRLSEDDDDDN